jgi:hypothetical protein
MTPADRIAAIKGRLAKRRPGNWYAVNLDGEPTVVRAEPDGFRVATCYDGSSDAIANTPADLTWLIARVEAFESAAVALASSGDICKLCGGASGYGSRLEHDHDTDGNGTPCPLHPDWKAGEP